MKTISIVKTITTVCGKTLTFFQEGDNVAKMHSMEGPAVIYPEDSKKAAEYFIYGIKYSKSRWQSIVTQHKAALVGDGMKFDY